MSAPARDDRARFAELFAETRLALLGYLVRRSESPDEAADLLAEVFLVAWRRIADVPAGAGGRLWLYGVARKLLANQRRRVRRERGLAIELAEALRRVSHEPRSDDLDPRLPLLADALASLGERDRELLTLTAWEDLSPAQIAVVLHQPVGVVRVRLHRARMRLRDRLAELSAQSSSSSSPSAIRSASAIGG
jgi:RNA polymerase sigma-70 factor (ECF subfamily)